jgi:hypothetical protein
MKIKWNRGVQKSLGILFKTLLVLHIKTCNYEEDIRNHFEHRKKKESKEGTFTNKIKNPWALQGSVMGHQGGRKVTWELHIINIITTTKWQKGKEENSSSNLKGGVGMVSTLYTLVQLLHVHSDMSSLVWWQLLLRKKNFMIAMGTRNWLKLSSCCRTFRLGFVGTS